MDRPKQPLSPRSCGPGLVILECAGNLEDLRAGELSSCAIVALEIPATTVLETDRILAFRDIDPQAPTHVLVIPKEHYPYVWALAAADGGLLGEVITGVHRVAEKEGVSRDGYRVASTPAPTRAKRSRMSTGTSSAAG